MPRRKTLKLSTPEEIRRSISRIANMILNEEIDPLTAKAMIYACNSALTAVRTDEYKRKVEELEALLKGTNEQRRNGTRDSGRG